MTVSAGVPLRRASGSCTTGSSSSANVSSSYVGAAPARAEHERDEPAERRMRNRRHPHPAHGIGPGRRDTRRATARQSGTPRRARRARSSSTSTSASARPRGSATATASGRRLPLAHARPDDAHRGERPRASPRRSDRRRAGCRRRSGTRQRYGTVYQSPSSRKRHSVRPSATCSSIGQAARQMPSSKLAAAEHVVLGERVATADAARLAHAEPRRGVGQERVREAGHVRGAGRPRSARPARGRASRRASARRRRRRRRAGRRSATRLIATSTSPGRPVGIRLPERRGRPSLVEVRARAGRSARRARGSAALEVDVLHVEHHRRVLEGLAALDRRRPPHAPAPRRRSRRRSTAPAARRARARRDDRPRSIAPSRDERAHEARVQAARGAAARARHRVVEALQRPTARRARRRSS